MVETEPCLSLRCGWSRWRRRKGSATPPSTPEIALPAVSQASYWERGNPSAATRRNLAVSQVLLFAVLRTGRIWFLCSRNKEPNQRNSRRASEHRQYKLQISQTKSFVTTEQTNETWMIKKKNHYLFWMYQGQCLLYCSLIVSDSADFNYICALHHLIFFFNDNEGWRQDITVFWQISTISVRVRFVFINTTGWCSSKSGCEHNVMDTIMSGMLHGHIEFKATLNN